MQCVEELFEARSTECERVSSWLSCHTATTELQSTVQIQAIQQLYHSAKHTKITWQGSEIWLVDAMEISITRRPPSNSSRTGKH